MLVYIIPVFFLISFFLDEPICAQGQEIIYKVPLNKRAEIVCNVMSDPDSELTFHWLFNTSREVIDIQQSQLR